MKEVIKLSNSNNISSFLPKISASDKSVDRTEPEEVQPVEPEEMQITEPKLSFKDTRIRMPKEKMMNSEEIKKHQGIIIRLSRYGTSARFGAYLKDLGFKLNSTDLKRLDLN